MLTHDQNEKTIQKLQKKKQIKWCNKQTLYCKWRQIRRLRFVSVKY